MKACNFTQEELDEIVATDNKKRYSYDGKGNIRANQGHSTNVEMNFKEVKPPEFLFHGTGVKYLSFIYSEGIKKMNRQHVHLSADEDTALKVGQRHGRPVILQINSGDMYNDGCKFYCSDNGVWLTDYVDPKYLKDMICFLKK